MLCSWNHQRPVTCGICQRPASLVCHMACLLLPTASLQSGRHQSMDISERSFKPSTATFQHFSRRRSLSFEEWNFHADSASWFKSSRQMARPRKHNHRWKPSRTYSGRSLNVQQAEIGTSQESQTVFPEKALVREQSSEVLPSPRKKLMTSVETALTQQSCCQRCHLLPYSSDSDSGDRLPASEKFCRRRTRQRNHPPGFPFLVSCHIFASSRD